MMKRSILIIDDDLLFRRALKYGLQDDKTSVYYAESAKEAMFCFAQNNYALLLPLFLLLNLHLSKDGIHIYEHIVDSLHHHIGHAILHVRIILICSCGDFQYDNVHPSCP